MSKGSGPQGTQSQNVDPLEQGIRENREPGMAAREQKLLKSHRCFWRRDGHLPRAARQDFTNSQKESVSHTGKS